MPRILITGCSSGFGLATARLFLSEGWEVIATMRSPRPGVLPDHERLSVIALDVSDADSIAAAVESVGTIDALVNNAGVGMLNVLEGSGMDQVRELFDTNVLGPIAMAKAFLPGMRKQGSGVIVNVSSVVTVKPLPALSVYSASKAALNAFTESLALEAAQFGVRTRLVLPGAAPTTDFGKNAVARMGMAVPEIYQPFVQEQLQKLQSSTEVTTAEDVARAVWTAVTEPDAPMRIPAGADAVTAFRTAGLKAA
ncbi:SDR family oxidoreductase [Rhizobium sp. NTR19]|uniref:SDR family oxidoreductase n=1 Tax=Neorhizobium turbinariae TaxID=2937795 RepID=A0ABT0INW0_9HYPH|nr:SDR family oxidoreductase [Neorhizobium turbinariae]MCK8779558.1 SDR family oxidoreductase [Neorhizobium turbinariae]